MPKINVPFEESITKNSESFCFFFEFLFPLCVANLLELKLFIHSP